MYYISLGLSSGKKPSLKKMIPISLQKNPIYLLPQHYHNHDNFPHHRKNQNPPHHQPAKQTEQQCTLLPNSEFVLNEKFQRIASKFAIFYIYENPKLLFPFFILCYFIFSPNECPDLCRHRPGGHSLE